MTDTMDIETTDYTALDYAGRIAYIRAELGEEEIARRVADLGDYETHKQVAAVYGTPMTPAVLAKWAAFAAALENQLGTPVTADATQVRVEKTFEEKAESVLQREKYQRER